MLDYGAVNPSKTTERQGFLRVNLELHKPVRRRPKRRRRQGRAP